MYITCSKAVISPSFVLDATILLLHFNRGGCGYGSESEGEEPADSRVTLPQNMPGRGNAKAQQSAIRLTEVLQKSCVLRFPILVLISLFASFFIHPSFCPIFKKCISAKKVPSCIFDFPYICFFFFFKFLLLWMYLCNKIFHCLCTLPITYDPRPKHNLASPCTTCWNCSNCVQLGPRMRLQLVKIEEGLCSGEVLFHEYGEIDK